MAGRSLGQGPAEPDCGGLCAVRTQEAEALRGCRASKCPAEPRGGPGAKARQRCVCPNWWHQDQVQDTGRPGDHGREQAWDTHCPLSGEVNVPVDHQDQRWLFHLLVRPQPGHPTQDAFLDTSHHSQPWRTTTKSSNASLTFNPSAV